MASFLGFSHDGAGLPLFYRLRLSGHDVKVWIEKDNAKHLYNGLLPKLDKWEQGMAKDRTCLFDTIKIGVKDDGIPTTPAAWDRYENLAEHLHKQGYPVVGGSSIADRLELDRTWGAEQAKRMGLLVPVSKRMKTCAEAMAYVKAHPARYMAKPHGNQETFKVYPGVEDSGEDMVDMLQQYRDTSKEDFEVELQEFIDGQQMSIEGYWTGTHFLCQNSTFEYKRMLESGDDDGGGPFTGETGSVVFYYPEGLVSKMQQEVLLKLVPLLKEMKFAPGPIDLNTIVNEDGTHFLEFSPRFGYPATYIQLFAIADDWGTVLEALGRGKAVPFRPKPLRWFLGNRVWIPEWPYGRTEKTYRNWPAFSRVKKSHLPSIAFVDVVFSHGRLRTGGTDGELMCVCAGGESINEAESIVHRIIEEVALPSMGWRNDVGEHIKLSALRRWGYWLPADR